MRRAMGDDSAQRIAQRIEQDQPDQASPNDQRIAEPRVEQPRRAQLDAERDEARGEDEQVEIAASGVLWHNGIIPGSEESSNGTPHPRRRRLVRPAIAARQAKTVPWRRRYDPEHWRTIPPHITVAYPFVRQEDRPVMQPAFAACLRAFQPFWITLAEAPVFSRVHNLCSGSGQMMARCSHTFTRPWLSDSRLKCKPARSASFRT